MSYIQTVLPIAAIKPNPHNTRTHSKKQIRQLSNSIRDLGWGAPVLVDEDYVILAGHARWAAARYLCMREMPVVIIKGLSDAKKRALMLADNRIAQNAGYDRERLLNELTVLPELLENDGLELSVTGFEAPEIDALHADFGPADGEFEEELNLSALCGPAVTKAGDQWNAGKHRLLCGDARNADELLKLLDGERASAAFLDPPYNQAIRTVVGRGATKHREFAMASGELSREDFILFLNQSFRAAICVSAQGALHYVCMDWRHEEELLTASRGLYGCRLNLAVWVKSNPGQGSFYRSQHELINVFRVGTAPHSNNIELGRHGRNRSNVWHYAGVNSFRSGRMDELRAHPTVKPTSLVADALKDCTQRNEVVLDSFCGSGSTILAAERVGRRAYGVEIDPGYVDVAIRRWQRLTNCDAVHAATGQTFEEVESIRLSQNNRRDQPKRHR